MIQDSIRELSNSEEQAKGFEQSEKSITDPYDEFKEFFKLPAQSENLAKAQAEITERIDSKTVKKLSYDSKKKEKKAKRNYLLSIADKFIYPLLSLPVLSDGCMLFISEKDLTVTYLDTVSLLLFHSMNR